MLNNSEQIRLLEEEIAKLPIGYISKKKIQGKTRYYRQWIEKETKKIKSQYIKDEDYEAMNQAIVRRKELQKQLDKLKKTAKKNSPTAHEYTDYNTNVMQGAALVTACNNVAKYQRRDCFEQFTKICCYW